MCSRRWPLCGGSRWGSRRPTALRTAHPLFRMPNPNAVVERLIHRYSGDVQGQLELILTTLESHVPVGEDTVDEGAVAVAGAGAGASAGAGAGVGAASRGVASRTSEDPGAVGADAAPPPMMRLQRADSSMFIGPGAADAAPPTQYYQAASTGWSTVHSVGEASVWFLVGKVFSLKQVLIGFPAFDQRRRLVGCFQEVDGSDPVFFPVGSL